MSCRWNDMSVFSLSRVISKNLKPQSSLEKKIRHTQIVVILQTFWSGCLKEVITKERKRMRSYNRPKETGSI